jgi:hypothetical protein
LLGRVSGLDGHIQMSILDKIAEGLEDEENADDLQKMAKALFQAEISFVNAALLCRALFVSRL